MKKRIVGLLLAMTMAIPTLTGCGHEDDGDKAVAEESVESASEDMEEMASDDGASGESSEESSKEDGEEKLTIWDTKEEAETVLLEDAEITGSYAEALNGDAKIKYTGKGDSFHELSKELTVGGSYTLKEITDVVKSELEVDQDPQLSCCMIDCGQDGDEELYIGAQYSAMYGFQMIIKEIDGEFVLCYDQVTTDRYLVFAFTDGTIFTRLFSTANIHSFEYSYVRSDGEYVFYYGYEETLGVDDTYNIYMEDSKISIQADDLDKDHIAVREYYYKEDGEIADRFYSFYNYDLSDDYMVIPRKEDSPEIEIIKSRFEEAGFDTKTSEEVDTILSNRAQEVGFPQ